uniref:DUF7787 domain-containing protein n=1 Tax=Cannabis sativa TaxID=3483 RepID=A0A803QJD2_CANSA
MGKERCCKPRSRAKMSLEEYIQFFHSRNYFNIPVQHLNQIISMHGYKKLHKVPKSVLIDAVSTLTLVSPPRSTLNDISSSPMVTITLDDVITDLNDLNWEEYSNQHHTNCSNGKKRQKAVARDPKSNGGHQRVRRQKKALKKRKAIAKIYGASHECGECLALDLFSIGSR